MLIAITTLVLASSAGAQTVIDINGGFENGTFTADTTFAGSQAVTLGTPGPSTTTQFPNQPITNWVGGYRPDLLQATYWVNSSAAAGGTKYLYLSGTDVCNNVLFGTVWGAHASVSALTIGQVYELTFYAASASTSGPQNMRVEWTDGNLPTQVSTYSLAANPLWSDTSLTTIPWEKHTYTFGATQSYGNLTFSTDASVASAIVIDGIQLVQAPEPGSCLLVGVSGLLVMFRRRRSTRVAE